MKRALGITAIAVLVTGWSLVAFAAVSPTNIDNGARWSKTGIWIGTSNTETATQAHRVAKRLGGSATLDFAAASVGVSSTISDGGTSAVTVTGAAVGDLCTVAAPAASSALNAKFSCVVTATDTVKVLFEPLNQTRGSVALSSGSPSTATAEVPVSSTCGCDPVGTTAAIAAAGCATSLADNLDGGVGTLTLTGPNTVTTTVVYDCAAPVDPASGTFYVGLERNGS